jgi:chromosomal replication initiation ATPase DnaA
MRTRITRQEFTSWIRPAVLLSVAYGVASISVPSARIKDGLEQRYSVPLGDLLTALLGSPTQVRVIVHDELAAAQAPATAAGAGVSSIDAQPPTATHSTPAPDHRPDWIRADQWSSLPAMLRAALIGSTVIEGAVQAISPHLTRLIATRYMHEVAALIAVVEPAPGTANARLTGSAQW